MAKLVFNKIRYQNIMSVGAEPIEIQLDAAKRTIITGSNGAGKSTMLEALCFGLFGKPFRDLKKAQLINSVNKKKLLVELWMTKDNDEYFIRRGQKPNIFEITRNGEKLDENASAKDFQEYFEELIGMNLNSFKQVVVLGTAGYVPFMLLPAGGRRKLVEDLLDVAVLGEMDKLNKAYIRELTQNIQVLEMKATHLNQQLATHRQYIEQAAKANDETLAKYQAMYDQHVEDAKKLKIEIERLTDEMANVIIGEDPTPDYMKLNTAVGQVQTQIQGFERVLTMHKNGGNCPTCMQEIVPGNDAPVIDLRDKAVQKLALIGDKVEEYRQKVADHNTLKANVQRITQEINTNKQQIAALVGKAKHIQTAIDGLKAEKVDNSEEMRKIEVELAAVVEQKSTLVSEKYHRGFIVEMLKDSGVKASIVKKYIPYFNERIQHYLTIMEADYVFTLDEEFNETIKSRGRETFSYNSFSQGEKQRIDIAMLFTWRDVSSKVSGTNISLLALDEIMDSSMDMAGTKALMSIVDTLQDNVYIISHQQGLNTDDFDRHLKMNKIGRFTVCNE